MKQSKLLYDTVLESGSTVVESEEFLLLERMIGEQLKDINSKEI
ncbi:hypothetical protein [Clostridium tepidiprofundi]|nr:hypothetical protein [Clostridium tepidiprofundi]